jgi:hypothetical protein
MTVSSYYLHAVTLARIFAGDIALYIIAWGLTGDRPCFALSSGQAPADVFHDVLFRSPVTARIYLAVLGEIL